MGNSARQTRRRDIAFQSKIIRINSEAPEEYYAAHLFKGRNEETKVDPPITVSFTVPEGVNADQLASLFWDGEKWVEVEGAHISEDSYFEAQGNTMGAYVLVTK